MSSSSNATVRIEVFRPGTFTPMEGQSITYTAADLMAAADVYDKTTAPAPVVVGHPTTDAPAYAWAENFEYDATTQRLYAVVGEINPAFAEAVRQGAYKKVSMSFHRPDSAANPAPGIWYPKHIGFLGGAAPAVTGLRNVQFDDCNPVVIIDADIGSPASFGTASTTENYAQFTSVDAVFAAKEAEFAAERAAWKRREQEFTRKENAEFAEKLIAEGRMLPAHKERIVSILDTAADSPSVSFSDGASPVPMLEALRFVLSEQPKMVSFGAFDLGEDFDKDHMPSIAIPQGYKIDNSQADLYQKARRLEREKGIKFADAIDLARDR